MKKKGNYLDFKIDKLTNSIENAISGDSFDTAVTHLTISDLKYINKKTNWLFDWTYEFRQPEREVYKLTIINNPSIIQGLISLAPSERHIYMHLIESDDNKYNISKKFD